jgi:putative membrane protein
VRSRVVTISIAAVGLILIAAGSIFAYSGTPETTATAARSTGQSDDPDGGVGPARSNLQQAGLPLAMLEAGVGQLADGSHQLDDGARQLSDGLRQARDGGEQLATGLDQLNGGVGLLGDGASQISGGVDEVVDRLAEFGGIQDGVTAQLTTVADILDRSPDPASRTIAAQLRALVETLNTQGLGPATLDQLAQLRDGAHRLAYELTDPNAQFVAGMALAADGSRQLRDGLVLLDDGGHALTGGTGQLVDGVGPVAGVVAGISDNVRSATDALPRATATPAEPAVTTSDRARWPYALIALGAAALVATAILPRGPISRRATAHSRPETGPPTERTRPRRPGAHSTR